MRRYRNFLTIGEEGKGIPYGGLGIIREDGDANHGFRDLKGRLERADEVPELVRDPALRELIEVINDGRSPLFSVGCASGAVEQQEGFGWSGYVEFAWDADIAVTDAQCYFPPFFHFNRFLRKVEFDEPAAFHWQIEGAHFIRAGSGRPSVDGFTATIWINVGLRETPERALESWKTTLGTLAHFLSLQGPRAGNPICPLQDAATIASQPG